MFWTLVTPLSTLLYINYAYSFQSRSDLEKQYINEVWTPELNQKENSICNVSNTRWTSICMNIFKIIRKNERPYESLRVSFTAFHGISRPTKCTTQILEFQDPLPDGNTTILQKMMLCFGRQAIVPAEEFIDNYEFYFELAIYPVNEIEMMVFKYDKNTKFFMLLEIYKVENWIHIDKVPSKLLRLDPPQYIDDAEQLYNKLSKDWETLKSRSNDRRNVININNDEIRYKIECMALGIESLANYGTIVPLEMQKTRNEQKEENVVLRSDLTELVLQNVFKTYTVSVYNKENQFRYLRMMGGPQENSVIFLCRSSMSRIAVYKIILLIENLHLRFISYYL